jgi:hypothetical protein
MQSMGEIATAHHGPGFVTTWTGRLMEEFVRLVGGYIVWYVEAVAAAIFAYGTTEALVLLVPILIRSAPRTATGCANEIRWPASARP